MGRFAREHGYRWSRLNFGPPQALSAPVAEMQREWYREAGLPTDSLYIESFTHVHPLLAVRSGLVPYWSVFNDRPSLEAVLEYLDAAEPFRRIYLSLFSNSIEAAGIAPIDEWRQVLTRAREEGRFLGVREAKYPRDLASFVRHYGELKRLDRGYELPEPLTVSRVEESLGRWSDRIELSDGAEAKRGT